MSSAGRETTGAGRDALSSAAGQATIEASGLVVLVALVLGALPSFAGALDGRAFGGFLAHQIACAVGDRCAQGERELVRAYGGSDAALVRTHAPSLVYEPGERQLPVDWRRCRRAVCADAPDDRDLDVHRSRRGARATVFTRVLRGGGRTYLQYWFYFPDSNTTWAGSDKVWEQRHLVPLVGGVLRALGDYPGYHEDDWESYVVRIGADGEVAARASSHGHWQGCKQRDCRNRWIGSSGWTRVSRGSHAGHIPTRTDPARDAAGRPIGVGRYPGIGLPAIRHLPALPGVHLRERTTTAEGLRLIPLETHDNRYRRRDRDVKPPWRKEAYEDPESEES
ncbi:MAG TPA: hypothetical protein VEY90_13240 [Thermoleophilaceae bacterium]|nr:hypothetical protein [Thermoleophilaceae bacterium]